MLSVIVPTCNRNELLSICLEHLAPSFQTLHHSLYEVIISDDGINSTAEELIISHFPWARWIAGPKVGPSANRNNGASQAKGDWLVFIDDDCIPVEILLKVYYDSIIKNPGISVFEGRTNADRPQQRFNEESPINDKGGYLWSCNFMIERKLFINTLCGFDERFPNPAVEDVELHYRLQKMNISIVFIRDALVIHPWRIQKHMRSITWKRFKSILYFLEKHPEKYNSINSLYYLKIFIHSSIKNTLLNSFRYKFRGFASKIVFDFMHLYFSVYLLFKKKESATSYQKKLTIINSFIKK
ncbi:glycosyltransferase family 2 protein [Hymenobacter caeli]|uniref:Glycosyltransferase involved in cell wall biosynthesis n=1 Tax=Hymenobacter caeli TaxID=2735894 RepID=A0ABX2FQQ0_9BACT|nr:glycosyltransferase [Hymenobacter caeli]NRT18724.1 glycosyltransferase involved in cell wall biosynthesis [Hymenobacter caeli]